MNAILFHPETSMRRALILALGTYGAEGLSPGEREPLTEKLLELYRNDPDAGIHGAAEWTLRQWKHAERLKSIDLELSKAPDRNRVETRWYLNGEGQTFSVIDGPVEFLMGSPGETTERNDGHRNCERDDDPPPVCHRHQGSDRRAIPAVREDAKDEFELDPRLREETTARTRTGRGSP